MQKILRAIVAAFFLVAIGYQYFYLHPVYINFEKIFGSPGLTPENFCPTAGVVLCVLGLSWQLILFGVTLVVAVSMYHWMYKGTPQVQWNVRPLKLFLYAHFFLLLTLSLYFFQSAFTTRHAVGWGSAMFSFLSLWGVVCFYLLLFLSLAALLGYRLLQLSNTSFRERSVRIALGVALGLSVFIFVFAILGQLALFSLGPVIAVAVLAFAFSYPVLKKVLHDIYWDHLPLTFSYNTLSWFLLLVLAIVLVMNMVDLLRPFPIGWDDLGVYMNFPRQIALHESLLPGYSGQAYMLLSALGFIVADSTTLAMFMSWFGGVLAVYALYAFGKQFISSEAGLLMATLMYVLPMTMHQSFADMKTDMGLFFFIVTGFFCLFLAFQEQDKKDRFWRLLVLSGVFLGTALAIKITTAIALFPLLLVLAWRFSGVWSGIGAFALLNALYFYKFVTAPDISVEFRTSIVSVSLLVGLVALVFAFMTKEKLSYYLRTLLVFGAALAFVLSPWLIKNFAEVRAVTVEGLMWGGPAPRPTIDWKSIGVNPATCLATSSSEELGRYISQDTGLHRYSVLPWDMTMNVNQTGFYVDISFLFLAFIGILLVLMPGWWNLLFYLIVTVGATLLSWIVSYFDSGGLAMNWVMYWPYVPFLLFAGMFFRSLYEKEEDLVERKFWQNVVVFFITCWYFWLFVASGIPWYGVAGFLFALLLVVRAWLLSQLVHRGLRIVMIVAIVLSLLSVLAYRETKFGNYNLLAYSFGLRSSEQVLIATNPLYPEIIKTINSDLEHPLYRVGTFINYFVDDNRERVFDDAQLDTFKCIDGDGADDARTLDRLKKLGFRYLVYDTNTASIEKDKNGTLHKKTGRFMDFAKTSLKSVVPKNIADAKSGIILFEIL